MLNGWSPTGRRGEGTLIISTPNRPVYTVEGRRNPFHRVEFDEDEFAGPLGSRFRAVRLFTRTPRPAGWWSLRSLAAERSFRHRIRGFWRLSTWPCPALRDQVDPSLREAADDVVLGRERSPSTRFDPYLIRARSDRSRERPYIFVAVAEGIRGVHAPIGR